MVHVLCMLHNKDYKHPLRILAAFPEQQWFCEFTSVLVLSLYTASGPCKYSMADRLRGTIQNSRCFPSVIVYDSGNLCGRVYTIESTNKQKISCSYSFKYGKCVNPLKSWVWGVSYNSRLTVGLVNSTSLNTLNWPMMPKLKCMSLLSASYSFGCGLFWRSVIVYISMIN
jgi:hypothetical protein